MVDRLLGDLGQDYDADALPLLAFILERLYNDFGGSGALRLVDYESLGGFRGAIEVTIERGLAKAQSDPAVPGDRASVLELLRRAFIPWLVGIDPETKQPRRRVARLSDIPREAHPLLEHLVTQRLLVKNVEPGNGGQTIIEVAHEAILRQWGRLASWLEEDAALLLVLSGVQSAARDWQHHGREAAWLLATGRLREARRLFLRPNFVAHLSQVDQEYLRASQMAADATRRRRVRAGAMIGALVVLAVLALSLLIGSNLAYLRARIEAFRPQVLSAQAEHALKAGELFKECSNCPVMVVVPAGNFLMGSPDNETGAPTNERPQHVVTIARAFAVSSFEVTFEEWDNCVLLGGCGNHPRDQGWGRGARPVINVNWYDAQQYASWLSRMTGKAYRLLTEAEWEYVARAGSQTRYAWGNAIGVNLANCDGCGSPWDNKETAPVGSFAPNSFGLNDMSGNVWEWVEDCYQENYLNAPADGSAMSPPNPQDCPARVLRGGAWINRPDNVRSAVRLAQSPNLLSVKIRSDQPDAPYASLGFRMARTLSPETQ